MTSTIKVNTIQDYGSARSGSTITLGGACKTVALARGAITNRFW